MSEDEDEAELQPNYDDYDDEIIQPPPNRFSEIDQITRDMVYDTPVVRLDYVAPVEYTREKAREFYDRKGLYNTLIRTVTNARINNVQNYSLRDIERTEARAKNLRNTIYNLYGRNIEDEWVQP